MNINDKYWDQYRKISLHFGTLIDRNYKRLYSIRDFESSRKFFEVKQSKFKEFSNFILDKYKEEIIDESNPLYTEGTYVLVLSLSIKDEYYFDSNGILASKLKNAEFLDILEYLEVLSN